MLPLGCVPNTSLVLGFFLTWAEETVMTLSSIESEVVETARFNAAS